MDSKMLYAGFQEIDEDILERSESAGISRVILFRRRFLTVLIAAILALFLMGAGIMASKYGDSIQSWFAHYWEVITGQDMSDLHASIIDRMSRKIDMRETVAGVTVTVDSAAVGDGNCNILLRVEGLAFSKKQEYGFEENLLKLAPETAEDIVGLFFNYSYNFVGLDADGAALFLINFDYPTKDEPQGEKPPWKVTLTMKNFAQDPKTDHSILLAEGEWQFTFSLDRSQLDIKRFPDTQVMGMIYSENNEAIPAPILLTNIRLTNTSFAFRHYLYDSRLHLDTSNLDLWIVLSSGQEIEIVGGHVNRLTDGFCYHNYTWKFPVNLDEAVAMKIGDTVITIQ